MYVSADTPSSSDMVGVSEKHNAISSTPAPVHYTTIIQHQRDHEQQSADNSTSMSMNECDDRAMHEMKSPSSDRKLTSTQPSSGNVESDVHELRQHVGYAS